MGYTHYWRATDNAEDHNEAYQAALRKAVRVVEASGAPLCIECDDPDTAPQLVGGIVFNGKGEDGHEAFWLPATAGELEAFSFCKTAQKPYDVIVTAVLATMKHFAPDAMTITSDGEPPQWAAGCKLASRILETYIPVPFTVVL